MRFSRPPEVNWVRQERFKQLIFQKTRPKIKSKTTNIKEDESSSNSSSRSLEKSKNSLRHFWDLIDCADGKVSSVKILHQKGYEFEYVNEGADGLTKSGHNFQVLS